MDDFYHYIIAVTAVFCSQIEGSEDALFAPSCFFPVCSSYARPRRPKPEVAKVIAERAKIAKQIIGRERTDSSIAGSLDGPMALGHAHAAQDFFNSVPEPGQAFPHILIEQG